MLFWSSFNHLSLVGIFKEKNHVNCIENIVMSRYKSIFCKNQYFLVWSNLLSQKFNSNEIDCTLTVNKIRDNSNNCYKNMFEMFTLKEVFVRNYKEIDKWSDLWHEVETLAQWVFRTSSSILDTATLPSYLKIMIYSTTNSISLIENFVLLKSVLYLNSNTVIVKIIQKKISFSV